MIYTEVKKYERQTDNISVILGDSTDNTIVAILPVFDHYSP